MEKRNLYLTTIEVEEALQRYLDAVADTLIKEYEEIDVRKSLGRITKTALYARYCSPLFNAAAMDGIAVVSAHTVNASERNPLTLKVGGDYQEIDTGDPIHPPYDGVIMAEDLLQQTNEQVTILEPAVPWQHVRPIGEDIVAGEMILPGSHSIRPIDIGVLLSAGITRVEVVKIPKVAIYPTGSELIEPEEIPKDGSIIESNSQMFAAMVTESGGKAYRFPAIADDYETLKRIIQKAADDYDLVIINAGSSAGREDYTVHVLKELGTVLVHGVAMKPGKPVILAIANDTPVIGLPGYPVSAALSFENFVQPTLALLSGREQKRLAIVEATVTRRLVSGIKYREYIRVKVGRVDGKFVAAPLARGAGAAMSLVRCDGFCVIPKNQEGVEAGERVQVQLYRDLWEIENTLIAIGSHDLMLDILADMMPNRHKNMFLASTHIGSLGGLMALQRGETHMAPIHLLDEETGEYNISYLKRIFGKVSPEKGVKEAEAKKAEAKEVEAKEAGAKKAEVKEVEAEDSRRGNGLKQIALIKGVSRVQGLLVKKGNPKNISGLKDLPYISYINRQRGSGTRILLDYLLKKADIPNSKIAGYDREVTTHMAVAALISSDSADAGLGIMAAARAFDLDFIPIAAEEYDFAIPKKYVELPLVQAFIQTLKSKEFLDELEELGGYRYEHIGEVVWPTF